MHVKTILRIAQIRIVPEKGDLPGTHGKLMAVLSEISRDAPDVVVTPVCFLDGYVATEPRITSERLREYAVDPSVSPCVKEVSRWAASASAWVIFGCSRLSPAGVYNSALIFDRRGASRGWYDKVHCQTHDQKFIPGDTLETFDSDFGPFGIMICADRRWPETVRSLALRGARIIFNPTYGMHDERNLQMMRTRSYESEIYIAFTHPKQSLLTGPKGEIVCDETGGDSGYSVSEIDLSNVDSVRSGESAHLRDRRPDVYFG